MISMSNLKFKSNSIYLRNGIALIVLLMFLLFNANCLKANNLVLSQPVLAEENRTGKYAIIQFDISWENSWRVSTAPKNYDGVWFFLKFKSAADGKWHHIALNKIYFNTGSQADAAKLDIRSDGKGAFFYRATNGTGSFSSKKVKVRWDYGIDGISSKLSSVVKELKVFGIEMVYIPQGAFSLGSGGDEISHFLTAGENNPYLVNSEDAIVVGTNSGNLAYAAATNSGDCSGPVPAAFPKGYKPFWCMKYEMTQEQYVDFLNTLTRIQQSARVASNISTTNIVHRFVMCGSTSSSNRNGIRCDAVIPNTSDPIIFYCDLNKNGVPNEADYGQTIACNYVCWADAVAYADWACLRQMTELEFEKAARGIAPPVPNEFAWGNTTFAQAFDITNPQTVTEVSNTSNANCVYRSGIVGPMRVGNFARSGSNRYTSGASYYGILDLSGNLWELIVTIGNGTGRNFSGMMGDGILDDVGNANVEKWPGNDAIGSGFKGGGWNYSNSTGEDTRISDRYYAAWSYNGRGFVTGIRCVSNAE